MDDQAATVRDADGPGNFPQPDGPGAQKPQLLYQLLAFAPGRFGRRYALRLNKRDTTSTAIALLTTVGRVSGNRLDGHETS